MLIRSGGLKLSVAWSHSLCVCHPASCRAGVDHQHDLQAILSCLALPHPSSRGNKRMTIQVSCWLQHLCIDLLSMCPHYCCDVCVCMCLCVCVCMCLCVFVYVCACGETQGTQDRLVPRARLVCRARRACLVRLTNSRNNTASARHRVLP